jgi:hypothetical protein
MTHGLWLQNGMGADAMKELLLFFLIVFLIIAFVAWRDK